MAYHLETAAIARYIQLLRHRTRPPMAPHHRQQLQSTCAPSSSIAPSIRATTLIAATSTSRLHTLEGENFLQHSVTSNDLISSTGKQIQTPVQHTLFFLAFHHFPIEHRVSGTATAATGVEKVQSLIVSTFPRPPHLGI